MITALVAFPFLMSGGMKVKGGAEVVQGMGHLGLPEDLILPLAILELTCVVIYLVPATSILGVPVASKKAPTTVSRSWAEKQAKQGSSGNG